MRFFTWLRKHFRAGEHMVSSDVLRSPNLSRVILPNKTEKYVIDLRGHHESQRNTEKRTHFTRSNG